ncbi:uncharacterized protein BXZ73DRAFT_97017 [Epithele typhae]|uniref:uncharacterized protein n=1 Tax=Epithele typhae TaxID=378194 RepID=UPI0020071FF2|nr:uncharacterized protein BXZ73DRAFT_97017 [Epithele typhae]KAH9944533.1 hypothetical protein BXZ73DRAFT_97017 [Epithele typhae]
MRAPTLLIVALAALGSRIANASPIPAGSFNSNVFTVSHKPVTNADSPPATPNLVLRDASPDHSPTLWSFKTSKIGPRDLIARALNAFRAVGSSTGGSAVKHADHALEKRVLDEDTFGGNAQTGDSGNVDGGDIINFADNYGIPTILNQNSNNGGTGGNSLAGCASGGRGGNHVAGGNGRSGTAGNAKGGSVFNSGAVVNVDSNNAGNAGLTQTGCAYGGDVEEFYESKTDQYKSDVHDDVQNTAKTSEATTGGNVGDYAAAYKAAYFTGQN